MAKLRIETNTGKIDVDGYVNVADNLYKNFDTWLEFLDSDPGERPDILQAAANGGGTHIIQQEKADGTFEPISNNNCRIVGERDKKKKANKSRVTVPIPDKPFVNVADFNYLGQYAQCIVDLYAGTNLSGTNPNNAVDKNKAHRFMFAMMAMTRCR